MANPQTCSCGETFTPTYEGQVFCGLQCPDIMVQLRKALDGLAERNKQRRMNVARERFWQARRDNLSESL